MTVWAGVATEDITPPPGVRLSGFAGRPPGGNIGSLDALRASALFLREGTGNAALVLTLDVIGLSPRDDARLRRQVGEAAGVSPDAVLIACSHTHAGPATMNIRATGDKERVWTAKVFARAVRAAGQAREAARPIARIVEGAADCDASSNRRKRAPGEAEGVRDPACRVLRLDDTDGRPVALMFHYAMHPVALGRTMRASADWVGTARREVEETLGCPALFLQGCCGDINPRGRIWDDFAAAEKHTEGVGQEVARATLRALDKSLPLEGKTIFSGSVTARLPVRPLAEHAVLADVEQRARQALGQTDTALGARHVAEGELGWVRACRLKASAKVPAVIPARVSLLAIGETVLVGLPGEIFAEIGLRVQDAVPGAWSVGYANGNLGYLYPDVALDEGGYEVDLAYRLYGERQADRGTAATLVSAAVRAVSRAKRP